MSTVAQNTTSTQLDQANAALVEISPNVTTEDRRAAMSDLNITARSTIVVYLSGQGKNLDTAIKLLEFFRKRIKERNDLLAA